MIISPASYVMYSNAYKATPKATPPAPSSSNIDTVGISKESMRAMEIEKFLSDKPFTKVRYTRILEQSPEKADMFITAQMEHEGVYNSFYDDKVAGKSYEEVLAHVNKLLEEDRQAVAYASENKTLRPSLSTFSFIFMKDDQYGLNHRGTRKTSSGAEYLPLDSDKWLSGDEYSKIPRVSDKRYSDITKLAVHKPIGQGDGGVYSYKMFDFDLTPVEPGKGIKRSITMTSSIGDSNSTFMSRSFTDWEF